MQLPFKQEIKKLVNPYRRKHAALRRFPSGAGMNISPDFTTGRYINIQVQGAGIQITIEPRVTMREFCNIAVEKNAHLRIAHDVFFNNCCSVNCLDKIDIGAHTLFGEGVKIYDHNHSYDTHPVFKVHPNLFTTAPVSIGSNCWIASNVTILKGVTIGDNVIIGANNLIYKSVPSNSIVKAKTDLVITPF